jgi:hypothetical protein
MRRGLFVAVLGLAALSMPMFGAIVIDFEQGSVTGGTITETAGGAIGVNIPVDVLKVTIGATTTFYDLFGAGPSSASDAGNLNGSALVNFNTNTGAFTIVGGVCTTASSTLCPGADTLVAGGTTLVNGTASSANIIENDSSAVTLTETDQKATALLTALGIPTSIQFELMNGNFNNLQSNGNGGFTVGSADIANVGTPEPTSILLFGTVLFGAVFLTRRARKA